MEWFSKNSICTSTHTRTYTPNWQRTTEERTTKKKWLRKRVEQQQKKNLLKQIVLMLRMKRTMRLIVSSRCLFYRSICYPFSETHCKSLQFTVRMQTIVRWTWYWATLVASRRKPYEITSFFAVVVKMYYFLDT